MKPANRVFPAQAIELLRHAHIAVDVRSEPEFERGHIPGALNIPLLRPELDQLRDNPDFLPVIEACLSKSQPLLLYCASGNRSLRAARQLEQAGYQQIVDLLTGIEGRRDEFGQLEPGWRALGYTLTAAATVAQTYGALAHRSACQTRRRR